MAHVQLYREFTLPFDLSIFVEIQPQAVTFTTQATFEDSHVVENTTTLIWEDLRSRYDRCGFDRWVVDLALDGRHMPLRNLHVDTYLTKMPPTEHAIQSKAFFLFHAVVRPEDTSFTDSMFFINAPDGSDVMCNIPMVEQPRVITSGRKFYWPQMSMAEISRSESSILIGIDMAENVNGLEVHLKTNVGYVPRKVTVNNGHAQFVLVPFGVPVGDVVTVKAGFEYFSNVCNLSFQR